MSDMRFDLVGPCPDCPFRSDIRRYLTTPRVTQIIGDLETTTFACHNTTSATKAQPRDARGRFAIRTVQHCGGALVAMMKSDMLGTLQQIAERLGMFDSSKLDVTAPVYSLGEMLRAYGCTIDERRYWLRELCKRHELTMQSGSGTPTPNSAPSSDSLDSNAEPSRSPTNYSRRNPITRTLAQLLKD